mgnify:CR=1 FL=1
MNMPCKAVRYDKDAYRIEDAQGTVVAMALRLTNDRWALYDTEDHRLSRRTWSKPAEVAAEFDVLPNRQK